MFIWDIKNGLGFSFVGDFCQMTSKSIFEILKFYLFCILQKITQPSCYKMSDNFEKFFWRHQIDQKTNEIFVRISALAS